MNKWFRWVGAGAFCLLPLAIVGCGSGGGSSSSTPPDFSNAQAAATESLRFIQITEFLTVVTNGLAASSTRVSLGSPWSLYYTTSSGYTTSSSGTNGTITLSTSTNQPAGTVAITSTTAGTTTTFTNVQDGLGDVINGTDVYTSTSGSSGTITVVTGGSVTCTDTVSSNVTTGAVTDTVTFPNYPGFTLAFVTPGGTLAGTYIGTLSTSGVTAYYFAITVTSASSSSVTGFVTDDTVSPPVQQSVTSLPWNVSI